LDPTGAPPPIDLNELVETAVRALVSTAGENSKSITRPSLSDVVASPIVTQDSRSRGPASPMTVVVATAAASVPGSTTTAIVTPPSDVGANRSKESVAMSSSTTTTTTTSVQGTTTAGVTSLLVASSLSRGRSSPTASSVAGTATVTTREPAVSTVVVPPTDTPASQHRGSAASSSVVEVSTRPKSHHKRSSATTPSIRVASTVRGQDQHHPKGGSRRSGSDRSPERRQRDRQHQSFAASQRPPEGSVTPNTSTGLAQPWSRLQSCYDDHGQLELVKRRRAQTERELEKLRREEDHLRRRHRDK